MSNVVDFKPRSVPVAEVFGPTIQGEGALAGSVSHFIRTGGCDYTCRWCDSAEAVRADRVRRLPRKTLDDIYEEVCLLPPAPWVTITGGNPALHELGRLVERLRAAGYKVAVETQGSIWKDWLGHVDMLTVSPKPPSSSNTTPPELLAPFYHERQLPGALCFKVVIFTEGDLEYAIRVTSTWPDVPFYLSVGTFMGGLDGTYADGIIDTREDILERYLWLAERVLADSRLGDARVFPQLHTLLWRHETGH